MIPTWGAAFGANAIFNSAEFRADLTHSAVPDKAAPGTTATFTRATTSTWPNNDGYLVTGVAGEIGFVGARRIYNKLTNTGWSGAASGTYGTVPTGWTADVGTGTLTVASSATYTGHNQITFTATAQRPFIRLAVAVAAYSVNILSVRVVENASGEPINDIITGSSVPAGSTETYSVNGSTVAASYVPVAGDVIEYKIATAATAGTPNWRIGLGCQGAATGSVTLVSPQLEDVTAQTTQTAGEYVSVGVESAPYYHGAGVDGVKCFPTDLAGNPLPTEYTYDAVSLNGVSGTYVSTSDSVANSITGDIDIRVKAMLTDWTPATSGLLVEKLGTVGQRSYDFWVVSTGVLEFRCSIDGTTVLTATGGTVTGFANGTTNWVRATRVASTGVVQFFTSPDGVTWSQLGADKSTTAGVMFDSTIQVDIGANSSGNNYLPSGKIYQAQIYNGINGTLAVDFNASRYAGGTTLTGSTGETWTLQGSAVIHPTNQPMLGYQAQGARTNLCLQSNAFTTTWTNSGAAPTQNVVGIDGATSAWTLTDSSAVATAYITQAITLTAAAYTLSLYVKKTTGAQASYPVLIALTGTGSILAATTIDTSNGVATPWTSFTGYSMASGISTRCTSVNSSFWRVELTFTGTAASWSFYLEPAAALTPTLATVGTDVSAQGSAVFYGAQVELGSFASSPIPTTTAAVTRNADVLTYSSAGNIDATKGWVYAEVSTCWNTAPPANWNAVGFGASIEGLIVGGVTGAPTEIRAYDGSNSVTQSSNPTMYLTPRDTAMTWGGSSMSVAQSGVATSGSFDGNIGTTAIGVGNSGTGTGQWNGTIRNVRIGQRALSSAELQAITS